MLNIDRLCNNMRTKVMKTNAQMFGSRSSAVIRGNFNTTSIVFENSTFDLGSGGIDVEPE